MNMKSLSGVGIGLSLVFGCLLLALVAELYYLLWWKKRVMSKKKRSSSSSTSSNHVTDNGTQIPAETPQFCYMFWCCRNPISSSTPQELCSSPTTLVHQPQSNKDLWLKPFSSEDHQDSNFPGLPRFLFTITEETREDLESEVGMSRRRNLSDLLQVLETPFLTPLASSPAASHHDHYFTPPLTPSLLHHHNRSTSAEFMMTTTMTRSNSSPPPKLKFLRDAEEKLMMRRSSSSPPPKMKFLRDAEEKLLLRSQIRTTIIQEINGDQRQQQDHNLEKLECFPHLQVSSSPTFKTIRSHQQTCRSEV